MTRLSVAGSVLELWGDQSLVEPGSRDFSGAGEYFTRASAATFVTGDVDFWVASWVKADTLATDMFVLTKYNASGNDREYALLFRTTGEVIFRVSDDGTNFYSAGISSAISAGSWAFLMGYHDSVNNEIGISINGGAFTTTAHTLGVNSGSSNFSLGRYHTTAGDLDGKLTDAAFGKPPAAITWTDIRDALYNNGQGLEWDELTSTQKTDWGLTANNGAWYPLNEESGNALDAVAGLDLTDTATVTASGALRTKALDWSGNRNHGTIGGTTLASMLDADLPSALAGRLDWSGVLDGGGSDYVDIPDSADYETTGDYSVSFWYRRNDTTGDEFLPLLCKRDQSNNDTTTMVVVIEDNRTSKSLTNALKWIMGTGAGSHEHSIDNAFPSNDTWYHVVLVMDGTTMRPYIDGVAKTTDTYSGTRQTNSATLEVNRYDQTTPYFGSASCSYTDIRIYSDVLTSDEISTLYAGGDHTDNLVFHMDLREGPGSGYADGDQIFRIADESGSGNEATQATAGDRPKIDSSTQARPYWVLDGTDDHFDVGYTPSGTSITWCAWVYRDADGVRAYTHVAENGTNDGTLFGLFTDNTVIIASDTDSDSTYQADEILTSTDTITGSAWHHIAVTVSAGTVTFYLDGTADSGGTQSFPESTLRWGGALKVGIRGDGSTHPLDGGVHGVVAFESVLTAAQITTVMNQTDPTQLSVPLEGRLSLTTVEITLFSEKSATQGSTKFYVSVLADETNRALINVPGLHSENEFINLSGGQEAIFEAPTWAIKEVKAKANTGTVQINYGILSRK